MPRTLRVFGLLLATAASTEGCKRRARPADTSTAAAPVAAAASPIRSITLERTPCFGTCPVYTVTVQSDGAVRFEGTRNVSIAGVQRWRVPADSVMTVLRYADSIQFANLPDRYDFGVSGCSPYIADLPGFAITVETAGVAKRVYADGGCPNIPSGLKAMSDIIDRIARVPSAP